MKIFKTKKTLSHPSVGSNPSDQPFWWDVYDALKSKKYTHIEDGNEILYSIGKENRLTKEIK